MGVRWSVCGRRLDKCEDVRAERREVEVATEDRSVDDYGWGEFGEELQVWMVGSEVPGENLLVGRGRVYLLHGVVDLGARTHGCDHARNEVGVSRGPHQRAPPVM